MKRRFRSRALALVAAVAVLGCLAVETGGASPAAAAPPPAAPAAGGGDDQAAPVPPLGSVLTAGRWTVDTAGRVLFLRGLTLPPATVPTATVATRVAAAGFDAVRLRVTFNDQGIVVDVPGADQNVGGQDAGIDLLAAAVSQLYDHGVLTMLTLVSKNGANPHENLLAQALTTVARRFAAVPGVVGLEIVAPGGSNPRLLNGAVRQVDQVHLLWRAGAAPFAPTANVVTNGQSELITGWGSGTPAAVTRLVDTADTQKLGWFYDQPAVGNLSEQLQRPYAAAVAGTPTAYTYDPVGRTFSMQYDTTPAGGGAMSKASTTQITVPAARYPDGYSVQVSGAKVVSKAGAGEVCLATNPGQTRVAVRIQPAAPGTGTAVAAGKGLSGCASGAVAPAGKGNAGIANPNAPVESGKAAGGKSVSDQLKHWALPAAGVLVVLLVIGVPLLFRRRRRRDTPLPDDPTLYL